MVSQVVTSSTRSPGTAPALGSAPVLGRIRISGALRAFLQDSRGEPAHPAAPSAVITRC
jgi:hypothetical protein